MIPEAPIRTVHDRGGPRYASGSPAGADGPAGPAAPQGGWTGRAGGALRRSAPGGIAAPRRRRQLGRGGGTIRATIERGAVLDGIEDAL